MRREEKATDAERRSTPVLSIVVLSFNRWPALKKTLEHLAGERLDEPTGVQPRDAPAARAQVIVVDNGSGDGTQELVRAMFPDVELVALRENRGVGAFNAGVIRATGDVLLILDDDARPDAGVLRAALKLMKERREIDAVVLNPVHPASQEAGLKPAPRHGREWPFADALRGTPTDHWPVMGCGNLVRRSAWLAVGGYDSSFFLYRNDTELALRLLASGRLVHFNPAWTVWHESDAIGTKSPRWLELATRNWLWTCRRHGRGAWKAAAMLSGWAWAHRLAGWGPSRQWRVVRGVAGGLFTRPLPGVTPTTGRGLRALMRMRLLGRRPA